MELKAVIRTIDGQILVEEATGEVGDALLEGMLV